jgi:hypothetical protein
LSAHFIAGQVFPQAFDIDQTDSAASPWLLDVDAPNLTRNQQWEEKSAREPKGMMAVVNLEIFRLDSVGGSKLPIKFSNNFGTLIRWHEKKNLMTTTLKIDGTFFKKCPQFSSFTGAASGQVCLFLA